MPKKQRIPVELKVKVRHPNLRDADDEQKILVARLLEQGVKDWARKRGVDPASLPKQRRRELLDEVSAALSLEEIERIWYGTNLIEQSERVEALCDCVTHLIRAKLMPLKISARRSTKRKYEARDQRIYALRKKRYSYGEIALRMKMERNAVQAVCRRETKRREALAALFEELRQLMKPLGIYLEEEPERDFPPVAKSDC
jgi:hypothetical protein